MYSILAQSEDYIAFHHNGSFKKEIIGFTFNIAEFLSFPLYQLLFNNCNYSSNIFVWNDATTILTTTEMFEIKHDITRKRFKENQNFADDF